MAKRLNLTDVCFALEQEYGLLSRAAVRLGCSRKGLYLFIQRHARAQEVLRASRESLIDDAEAGLRKAVQDGDWRAIVFVLVTIGKFRGYITAKDLSPAGQSRLPNSPDGQTDEPWLEALRPRRRWEDAEDAEDWAPEPDPEPLVDWEARETELIRDYEARLAAAADREAALIARYEPILQAEVAEPGPDVMVDNNADAPPMPAPADEDDADADEDQELGELLAELRRRLQR
jgi:hypothetical protein